MKKSYLLSIMYGCVINLGLCASASAVIVNGSFETGDYTGWTLFEGGNSTAATSGIWGIATNGQTVSVDDSVFDYNDGVNVTQNSPGLPITYTPTDGNSMALQLQRGPQTHRMYQDVTLENNASQITWDMFYANNTSAFTVGDGGVESGSFQFLAVYLRDLSDNILDTLFITNVGDPLSIGMSSFSADVSSYAGQTVRLDVFMEVDIYWFDAGFDNFQVATQVNAVPIPPAAWLFGSGLVGLLMIARSQRTT